MATVKKIVLNKKQKKLIDGLIKNAYSQGFLDGFKVSGKQFNGISGMFRSSDFKDLAELSSTNFMKDNEELFNKHYKIEEPLCLLKYLEKKS